ncbi:hypothetical protein [Weissella confusa]|uniref:hypothetical protein n=1 Tax=Weissella confusa TaxID=1583 RepID=UPI00107FBF81|nr:hypothetical protein [Weissella confusa]
MRKFLSDIVRIVKANTSADPIANYGFLRVASPVFGRTAYSVALAATCGNLSDETSAVVEAIEVTSAELVTESATVLSDD